MCTWNENVWYYELFNHEALDISDDSLMKASALSWSITICEKSADSSFPRSSRRDAFKDVFALLMRRLGRCGCIEDLRKCPSLLSITSNVAYSRHAIMAHFIRAILINSAVQTHAKIDSRWIPFDLTRHQNIRKTFFQY